MPNEIITFLVAMTPVGELRASLPLAIEVFNMPIWKAYLLSVAGNIVPVFLILWLIGPISNFLRRFKIFDKFFTWLFARTRRKTEGKYAVYGELALILFVAIPLPITGAWTGSLAAFLFGVPKKRAIPLIVIGVIIAGFVVTLATLGVVSFLRFLV
ncbi:MAG: small multi-drug export protein [Patescibacteria group bacterium]|nr:small multi-drug export protein [Patescibacteria group bacterium]